MCFSFGPYFVEPVIAGLDPKTSEPFIASLDLIGCPMVTEDFVVSGTCSEQMYGMCETLYKPNQVYLQQLLTSSRNKKIETEKTYIMHLFIDNR